VSETRVTTGAAGPPSARRTSSGSPSSPTRAAGVAAAPRTWAPKGVRGRPVLSTDAIVAGLRGIADSQKALRQGQHSHNVQLLQLALNKLGYKLDAKGTYGPRTAAAVKDFAARNLSLSTLGTVASPDVIRALANNVDRAAFGQSIARLSNAVMADDPKFFENASAELRRIQAEPTDAARAEHLRRWLDALLPRIEARASRLDKELPGWRQDLARIVAHFNECTGSPKTLLVEAKFADSVFRDAANERLRRNVLLVADALSQIDPSMNDRFMANIDKFESADGDAAKLEVFGKAADDIGHLVNHRTEERMDELDPTGQTRHAWLELRGTFIDAIRTGATGPLAVFMQQTYLRHTLESIHVDPKNPKQIELTSSLTERLVKMQAAAEAKSPKAGALTPQMLQNIVPGLSAERAAELSRALNDAMDKAGIQTPRQRAAFIAQCAEETGGFQWFHELGKAAYFSKYDNRSDLGNRGPPDGVDFKGRGALMLTGRFNYGAYSKWETGSDLLVRHPELLEQPKYAFGSAAWYWSTHGLNKPAEANDFTLVTKRINGGTNGEDARLRYYARGLTQFAQPA
jgi:putative chitinase